MARGRLDRSRTSRTSENKGQNCFAVIKFIIYGCLWTLIYGIWFLFARLFSFIRLNCVIIQAHVEWKSYPFSHTCDSLNRSSPHVTAIKCTPNVSTVEEVAKLYKQMGTTGKMMFLRQCRKCELLWDDSTDLSSVSSVAFAHLGSKNRTLDILPSPLGLPEFILAVIPNGSSQSLESWHSSSSRMTSLFLPST